MTRNDRMATTQSLLRAALVDGDRPQDLECIYQPHHERWRSEPPPEIVRCRFDELPERVFDAGYGTSEGESCIAFSHRHVYVHVVYDGSEWFEAVPRHPDEVHLGNIPLLGGE